jgi:NAD(P)-dependent dehydrogenase (short-subunit alcohol dehydrogenase family)
MNASQAPESAKEDAIASGLAGKVAVVTGSTGGIGEGIAHRLAADGAAVVVSGRRAELGERVVSEIADAGGRALFVQADVAREEGCDTLISQTVGHLGRLDILVNNAGIFPSLPLEEVTVDLWDQVFAVNVRGSFLCSRAALAPMRAQGGGCIVNIGSTTAYRGTAGLTRLAYASSKGALLTMTKTMAMALLPDRIRVNWVTVGWVATPGEIELRDQLTGDGQAFIEKLNKEVPLGRLETVEDIAAGVAYLVSDGASHVTGCELNISGGRWI